MGDEVEECAGEADEPSPFDDAGDCEAIAAAAAAVDGVGYICWVHRGGGSGVRGWEVFDLDGPDVQDLVAAELTGVVQCRPDLAGPPWVGQNKREDLTSRQADFQRGE